MTDTPITHSRVLKIALPIVLSNITVPLLGLVDTGVIGQLGQAAPIGAVGIGAFILSAAFWMFGFLRMGITGLTAQAIGAGDSPEVSALLMRALLVGAAGGAVLIAGQVLVFAGAFALSPASDQVESLARDYMAVRIWSAPAAIAMFGITGWLIAAERTRSVLLIQVWMNGLNVVLDLWFVLGLGWGVQGVAFATFLADWSGLALGLWVCRGAFARPGWRDPALLFARERLRRMARISSDILIRLLLLEAIMLSFIFTGAGYGDATLAANQILLQFLALIAYGLDGFAFAAETLVGQAFGRGRVDLLKRAARFAFFWGFAVAAVQAVAFALMGDAIIDIMTTAVDVRAEARQYLLWIALTPLAAVAAFVFDGIFVGATASRDMRNMMAVSAAIYAVAVLVLAPAFQNHGLWAALMIAFVARGVTMALRYPSVLRGAEAYSQSLRPVPTASATEENPSRFNNRSSPRTMSLTSDNPP
ncbi:MATE family efflux transporter [Oceaniovalibus sp. ACAM 378]|uniref:MATE family efflux transporter n=1 Tax=Oceaniovalibus sp. ACAM 378 TaxID=2599923 RepID=UPI0011DA2008|nr:MATE family efflux transporter [Oceaniovalibus sp. ACAM 378]TYB87043.1 MATE family efflux transporter [Oceaniovalibus sp. ACAM 378]